MRHRLYNYYESESSVRNSEVVEGENGHEKSEKPKAVKWIVTCRIPSEIGWIYGEPEANPRRFSNHNKRPPERLSQLNSHRAFSSAGFPRT
jgi:hypothetical protein